MAGYYQMIEAGDGTVSFHLRAGNHEVILSGTVHHSRDAALDTIEWIRTHAHDRQYFEPRRTAGGGRYFVLQMPDGRIVGRSEVYARTSGVETGIASVQRNCGSTQFRGLVRRMSFMA
jgi:uncharacterized protein YegP (UPF0339 family)